MIPYKSTICISSHFNIPSSLIIHFDYTMQWNTFFSCPVHPTQLFLCDLIKLHSAFMHSAIINVMNSMIHSDYN